jgi:hypothetical protein
MSNYSLQRRLRTRKKYGGMKTATEEDSYAIQIRHVLPKCVSIGLSEYRLCNITLLIFTVCNQTFTFKAQIRLSIRNSKGSGEEVACL